MGPGRPGKLPPASEFPEATQVCPLGAPPWTPAAPRLPWGPRAHGHGGGPGPGLACPLAPHPSLSFPSSTGVGAPLPPPGWQLKAWRGGEMLGFPHCAPWGWRVSRPLRLWGRPSPPRPGLSSCWSDCPAQLVRRAGHGGWDGPVPRGTCPTVTCCLFMHSLPHDGLMAREWGCSAFLPRNC